MKQEINATQPALSPSLEKVRDRFETWRRRKKPGSRIPKALWLKYNSSVGLQYPVFNTTLGSGSLHSIAHIGPHDQNCLSRLEGNIPPSHLLP
jgi:hypothetical protein